MKNIIVKIVTVVLGFGRLRVSDLIKKVEAILLKMTSNPNFTTPNPALTVIATEKDELKLAAATAENGTKEDRANVKVKRRALMLSMSTLRAYVETVANGNPKTAEVVALSSGMSIKKVTPPPPRVFRVKNTALSGQVLLTCPREKGELMFDYQFTLTPEVLTSYISIGALPKVTRTIEDLTVGKLYYFRFAAFTKDGQTDWSNPISIIVT